ncbi:30S ribosome-binding factor RbfA [candidate division KSB1 bacterium]|nr:30S ribosome-binding factor RbfA [candidate division KSB1 bacterium]
MAVKRSVRIAERIRREAGRILLFEVKDPGVKPITISEVRITDDLKLAKIYYTVFDEQKQREQAEQALQRAGKFIRSEIGKCIDLRFIPEIEFHYDKIPEQTQKLNELFAKIRDEEHE